MFIHTHTHMYTYTQDYHGHCEIREKQGGLGILLLNQKFLSYSLQKVLVGGSSLKGALEEGYQALHSFLRKQCFNQLRQASRHRPLTSDSKNSKQVNRGDSLIGGTFTPPLQTGKVLSNTQKKKSSIKKIIFSINQNLILSCTLFFRIISKFKRHYI